MLLFFLSSRGCSFAWRRAIRAAGRAYMGVLRFHLPVFPVTWLLSSSFLPSSRPHSTTRKQLTSSKWYLAHAVAGHLDKDAQGGSEKARPHRHGCLFEGGKEKEMGEALADRIRQ
jgi:hypothetical protein